MSARFYIAVTVLFFSLASIGCRRDTPTADSAKDGAGEVVAYVALDQEFSEPILEKFTQRTGIRVLPKFDTESTKTVGLTNAVIAEKGRPRCDLFWNNEILNTLRLKKQGLLDTYESPTGKQFPEAFRDAGGAWYGLAARARVLIVNTDLVAESDRPDSVLALADPKWKGKCGIAKPLFGTTATHAAVLFSLWGDEKAGQFFRDVKENAQILSGNKQVAVAVGRGQLAFGLTDTDDAHIEQLNGLPVAIVYPDQGEGQMGTLFIPNTLCLIKGSPNGEAARKLLDYLLSPEVEAALAQGRSAQIPLGPGVEAPAQVATPATVRPMAVDFEAAVDRWDAAATFLTETFAATP